MGWSPEKPNNALPMLPPRWQLETVPVLKLCIEAREALALLKGAAARLPNPAVLIGTIPVLEARASSAIENIVTTNDALFRSMSTPGRPDAATKEALRYRQALVGAFHSLQERPISVRTAEAICTLIRDLETRVRQIPGTRLGNAATGETIYTPPEGADLLRGLLANWESFIHGESALDPLVQVAVSHYQFEAIHPFTDGNGRTGRILNSLLLVHYGLLDQPILYLSRYILKHRLQYYRLLLGVTRESAWEPWLLYLLAGIRETAIWTIDRIDRIREMIEDTCRLAKERAPKIYSRELIELLFEQPYTRIASLVDAGLVGRQAASRHLKELSRAGILEEQRVGRDVLFLNAAFLELLTS